MHTDQLISQEASWPAGWLQLPYQLSFSTAALEHQAAVPVDTSCARATDFRPAHHTSEKDNTEYTSATVQAARMASTVISYTFLVLVHVQESYLQ